MLETSKQSVVVSPVHAVAGVATAFAAPIGGLLFTIEEGASFYSTSIFWRSFLSTCIGVLTLHFLVSCAVRNHHRSSAHMPYHHLSVKVHLIMNALSWCQSPFIHTMHVCVYVTTLRVVASQRSFRHPALRHTMADIHAILPLQFTTCTLTRCNLTISSHHMHSHHMHPHHLQSDHFTSPHAPSTS